MKKYTTKYTTNYRRGAIIVYGAFGLFLMLVMAAISIDVAYMQLVRTELRIATDSASVAGCEALGRLQSRDQAILAARAMADVNKVARAPLLFDDADIQIGNSVPDATTGRFVFTELPGDSLGGNVNSVRVLGRRTDGSPSGKVQLFMAGILSTEFFAPQQFATSTTSNRDIGLVLDRSTSMAGPKIAQLKTSVELFFQILESLPDGAVRCSLTSYATDVTLDAPLTDDFVFLNNEAQNLLALGNTNIGDALRTGAKSVVPVADGGTGTNARPFANRAVILLSDGRNTTGNAPFDTPFGETTNSVEFCVEHAIPVFTISFGSNANHAEMQQIADDTGGFFRNANNGADLDEAFREIAERIAVAIVQ